MFRLMVLPISAVALLILGADTRSQAADSPEVMKLRAAQLETAKQGLEVAEARLKEGRGNFAELLPWSQRVLQAKLALSDKKPEQIAAYEEHLKRLRTYEDIAKARVEAGSAALDALLEARFHRQEAEIWLAMAKGK